MSTKRMTLIALMAAIICVLSPLSIPLTTGVPISLATLAVMLVATLLGPVDGTIAVIIYLILGAVGLPVFSGFSAGFGKLFGITGGFLFGYIPLAFISGWSTHYLKEKSAVQQGIKTLICLVLGNIALYALGVIWFVIVTGSTFSKAMTACVIPFIPGDLIKIVIVIVLANRLTPIFTKYRQN